MIAEATRRRECRSGYAVAAAESLPLRDASFDICISYITLVDIVGYIQAVAEMARVLKPGGELIVANLGFVTASDGWQRDDCGNRLYHRVDRYAEERSRTFEWVGIRIVNWHRPLSAYMSAYLSAGLILREFLEPVPVDRSLETHPDFEDWFRVPLFNVMKWKKPEA
jgi:SAM-dependent methyltransferase